MKSIFSISFITTIIFVVLKLTQTIDWSWWWVLSPLWISILLVVVVFFLYGFVEGLKQNREQKELEEIRDRIKRKVELEEKKRKEE